MMTDHDTPIRPAAPDLIIRARRLEDWQQIEAMTQQPRFLHNTLRLPFRNPEEARRRLEAVKPEDTAIVAELDGLVVGAADLTRGRGRRAHSAVLGIGVHDGHQGQGIGTALLRTLVDAADLWLGLHRIELTVFADNAAAIALYRRFGFTEEGRLRDYALRAGGYADCLAMARLRHPPSAPSTSAAPHPRR
ncbi:GNAT family N-acetyltransferase [Oleisolibacter albus]|uniref:GNAT family N-acetyltransferase n=1 Tax=Oleisolibacter albus TaxID=2171757 RepID=UPI0019617A0B|nr:GNAT family N-acetyltransferase [Oleisolibacter albus]